MVKEKTFERLRSLRESETPLSIHMMTTGAGAGAQSMAWSLPGSSRYLSGATFPYDKHETDEWALGFSPGQYASESTAVDLAIAAFTRALPNGAGAFPVGVGLAASVASTDAHRGDHRVHVATLTSHGCRIATAVLPKGLGQKQRERDGRAADELVLRMVFSAVNIASDPIGGGLISTLVERDCDDLARERLAANPLVLACGLRRPVSDLDAQRLVLHPGTFNPPHVGHIGGSKCALDVHHGKGRPTARLVHWLTTEPPNKPQLTVAEALKRARAISRMGHDTLITAGDPLYVDKAARFPGAALVVGVDSLIRMLDPQWGVAPADVISAFERHGTRVYVVGREVDGEFLTLASPRVSRLVPFGLGFIFSPVPGRWDVSSTQLRELVSSTSTRT